MSDDGTTVMDFPTLRTMRIKFEDDTDVENPNSQEAKVEGWQIQDQFWLCSDSH